MNQEQQYYFDMGVTIGESLFITHLHGDSLMASQFNDKYADVALKKAMKQFSVILHCQDIIKRGIVLGVKTAGVKQPAIRRVK